ncbi:MAG TPA: ribbon-helix-helix protein, CopG family [Acidimicrobiales bacterium]|nr:ribbon-helix-helix protein, CopG family [Acidimicrobiales bacterium]
MYRTNIYLDEGQAAALDDLALAAGISRAELVRRFIDRGINDSGDDLQADLEAIESSFGVLAGAELTISRAPDGRWRHLSSLAADDPGR